MESVISPDGAERLAAGCGLAAACALSTLYIYATSLHRWHTSLTTGPANVILRRANVKAFCMLKCSTASMS